MNSKASKSCAVPLCTNTSVKSPKKLFIYVPHKRKIRYKWLKLAGCDSKGVMPRTPMYFCEDHFDLPNDMENFTQYRLMGSVSRVRLKPGCIPTKFDCQPNRRRHTANTTDDDYILIIQRKMSSEQCEEDIEERTIFTTEPVDLVETSFGNSGNDKPPFIWTSACTNLLLTLYEENMEKFESGSQRHKKLWATISSAMKKKNYNVSWPQCQSKLNGMKKTYRKLNYRRSVSGNDKITWPYYHRMKKLFGSSDTVQPTAVATLTPTSRDHINNNQTNKKRKASINIKKYMAEMTEEKKMATEKIAKIDQILKQKKEHHKEKMAMMQQLINVFVARKT